MVKKNSDQPSKPIAEESPATTASNPGGTLAAPPQLLNGMPLPPDLPVLSVRDMMLFPNKIMQISLANESDQRLIDRALADNRLLLITQIKEPITSPAEITKMHPFGCIALIHKTLRLPDGETRILVQGIQRSQISALISFQPQLRVRVSPLLDIAAQDLELQALFETVKKLFARLASLITLPEDVQIAAANITDPGQYCDMLSDNIGLSNIEVLSLFDEIRVNERCKKTIFFLLRYLQIMELSNHIQADVQKKIDGEHKQYYLREQLKAIQKELGASFGDDEILELEKRAAEKKLPEEADKELKRELARLNHMRGDSAEFTVSRTYIEWLLELPWNDETADNINLKKAKTILDHDHYNLKKIKERIIEFLAVRKNYPAGRSPILCLVGPPGVGKTSLGKSIANAMGRKFVRHSLGGVRDEAEIRGHRRTYIGALPGRIIQGLKRAGSRNPIFMLDEIDKLAGDFHGDPASALLEALDPEQNFSFLDHYLDVPFDLSKTIFIATANQTDSIPFALLDRMEIINIAGYSPFEKKWIVKKHLLPRIIREHGLTAAQFQITDPAIDLLTVGYTREAGLRNLERQLTALARKATFTIVNGASQTITATPPIVKKMLGAMPYCCEIAGRTNLPGIAVGLVWSAVGGGILFIESALMSGSKNLQLTGSLGDVIKESALTALSWIRAHSARLPIDSQFYDNHDFHIHFPEGATPKDGPSAGLALIASLISLLAKTCVKPYLAMTGEITLRGKVLPVGGIKEKMLGAHLAGIKEIILPKHNLKDLDDLPREVRRSMKFYPVTEIREMLPIAFPDFKQLKKPKKMLRKNIDAAVKKKGINE